MPESFLVHFQTVGQVIGAPAAPGAFLQDSAPARQVANGLIHFNQPDRRDLLWPVGHKLKKHLAGRLTGARLDLAAGQLVGVKQSRRRALAVLLLLAGRLLRRRGGAGAVLWWLFGFLITTRKGFNGGGGGSDSLARARVPPHQ